MKWSQLRLRTRENLCDELKKRVDFHVARYRKSHDGDYRRGWISVDGEQLASWSCFEQLFAGSDVQIDEVKKRFPDGWSPKEYDRFISERGIYSGSEFMSLLFEYLSFAPHKMLNAEIPLLRALAILDRRVGKRSIASFEINKEEDPIVTALYHLRLTGSLNKTIQAVNR